MPELCKSKMGQVAEETTAHASTKHIDLENPVAIMAEKLAEEFRDSPENSAADSATDTDSSEELAEEVLLVVESSIIERNEVRESASEGVGLRLDEVGDIGSNDEDEDAHYETLSDWDASPQRRSRSPKAPPQRYLNGCGEWQDHPVEVHPKLRHVLGGEAAFLIAKLADDKNARIAAVDEEVHSAVSDRSSLLSRLQDAIEVGMDELAKRWQAVDDVGSGYFDELGNLFEKQVINRVVGRWKAVASGQQPVADNSTSTSDQPILMDSIRLQAADNVTDDGTEVDSRKSETLAQAVGNSVHHLRRRVVVAAKRLRHAARSGARAASSGGA